MRKCQRTKKQTKPNKPQESYPLKQLLRDFFASLKSEKLFGELIANSQPLTQCLSREYYLKEELGYRRLDNYLVLRPSVRVPINDKISYKLSFLENAQFCETFESKIHVLEAILADANVNDKTRAKFLRCFVRYYCKKNNIKAIYNPLMFKIWMGTFFATFAYLEMVILMLYFFGIHATLIFAIIITALSLYIHKEIFNNEH